MPIDLKTIDDERGRFAALAAVLLATFVYALIARNSDWSAFVQTLIFGVAATVVILPAYVLPRRDTPPPGWLSALLVAGFFLTAGFWFSLADLLGANTDDLHASTVTWIAILLAAEFAYLSQRHDSAICTLLAAGSAVVAVLALIDWVFSPESTSTFRYIMIVEGLVLIGAGVALYRDRGRHAVVLAVLSGIVILAMASTFLSGLFTPFDLGGEGPTGPGWGWELIVLAFGLGLAAFAAMTREPGPGYAAALLLLAFVALSVVGEDGFLGWPLVLLLLFAGALAAFLRPGDEGAGTREPRQPVPPADTTHEARL